MMLIVALALSALNAIMGCARSLHQMSVDGQFPRFFQRMNQHGVPALAMAFNVSPRCSSCSPAGPSRSTRSRTSATPGSFLPVLVGYYLLRKYRPNVTRPFRLPEFFKYVALAMAALYASSGLRRDQLRPHRRHRDLLLPRLGRGRCLHPVLPYRTRIEDKRLRGGGRDRTGHAAGAVPSK